MAGPWLVRRFLEGRAHPRALVWAYLSALLAAVGATLVLLVALMVKYLPHDYLAKAGLVCHVDTSCRTALPVWALPAFPLLVGGSLLGLALYGAATLCVQLGSSRALLRASTRAPLAMWPDLPARLEGRVVVMEEPALVSYAVGFFHPRVVISSGLLESLDADEIRAVLAHEEAHLAGRDNLLILAAQTVAYTFVLVPGARFAYARFRRALELAADSYARRSVGDPLVLASSLQKFARRLVVSGQAPQVMAAFADEGHVVERIHGLLDDEVVCSWRRRLAGAALLLTLVFGAFTGSALAFADVGLRGTDGCDASHSGVSAVSTVAGGVGVGAAAADHLMH